MKTLSLLRALLAASYPEATIALLHQVSKYLYITYYIMYRYALSRKKAMDQAQMHGLLVLSSTHLSITS